MLWYTVDEILKYHKSIKDGDILLFHKEGNWFNSIGAKLIQFGTAGPFNHACVAYHKDNELRVIEADTMKGVVDRTFESTYKNTPNYLIVLRPTLMEDGSKYTKLIGKNIITTSKRYLGQRYGFIDLTVFVLNQKITIKTKLI